MRGVRDSKSALVVPRSRGQLCGREGLATMSGNQSGGFCLALSFCCLTSLPLICSPGVAPKQRRVVEDGVPAAAAPSDMAESSRRVGGARSQSPEAIPVLSPSFLLTMVRRFFHLLDCFTRIRQQVSHQMLRRWRSRVIACWRRLGRRLLPLNAIMASSLRMIRS